MQEKNETKKRPPEINEEDKNCVKLQKTEENSPKSTSNIMQELKMENQFEPLSLDLQFKQALKDLDLEKALEIVKNIAFKPNQKIKNEKIVTTSNLELDEISPVEETPLLMLTDLNFEKEISIKEGQLFIKELGKDVEELENQLNEIVKVLIGKGADVNLKDAFSNTPILNAMFQEHYQTATTLLYSGANPNLKNKNDLKVLTYAINAYPQNKFIDHLLKFKNLQICVEDIEACQENGDKVSAQLLEKLITYVIEENKTKDHTINQLTGKINAFAEQLRALTQQLKQQEKEAEDKSIHPSYIT